MLPRLLIVFSIATFFAHSSLPAQVPIGNWRDHLPYAQAIQVTESSDKIWCATPFSIFSIDKAENSIDRWSKVNGLNETGINCIAASKTNDKIIIAYNNSNIDVISGSIVKNINSIKNSTLPGDKSIKHIYIKDDLAYLATGLGIIVINLQKPEVKETYIIGDNGSRIAVRETIVFNNYLYAATELGLKRALLTGPNLSDYRNWEWISGNGLSNGNIDHLTSLNNQLLLSKNDSVFIQNGNAWSFLYRDGWRMNDVKTAGNQLLISETLNNSGRVLTVNLNGSTDKIIQNNQFIKKPLQSIFSDNNYWIADSIAGLSKYIGTNFQSYVPNSPASISDGEMVYTNKRLLVAAGSVSPTWQPTGNKNGFFQYEDNSWKNFNASLLPLLDSMPDCITVAIDPRDGTNWIGSYGGGLFSINNNTITVFKQQSVIQPAYFSPRSYRVSGLAFDTENNLWVSNYGGNQNIHVRKNDGNWKSFAVPFPLIDAAVGSIVIDNVNQKWIIAPNGQGLICFNHGNSIDNTADDRWKWFRTGTGNGNLPDNNVLSIIKDKNSFIWIGTKQGIGIVQCPQEVFSTQPCEAILPIVQQDNFAGYLFRDEEVQCMAVDGADRKWVGTKNGVWLISADAEKTIERFTVDNSPLPDNDIKKIAIDGNTGEVYFSTAKGIVSYKSTATEGKTTNENVLVYPNPVPPGYSGSIAIRGVANNAIVKITELDGRLVHQTRALGGQAVWNGKNYKGQNISSGIYLVMISTEDKKEKMISKIVFISK